MAIKNLVPTFRFVGRLNTFQDELTSNGEVKKGSFRDNGNGFRQLVFKGNIKEQGEFNFYVSSFSNPVIFTLNEEDSKGNKKRLEHKGGKLDTTDIVDLWKSTYRFEIEGKQKEEVYHSKDFFDLIFKNLKSIESGKLYFDISGKVEKSFFNNRLIEKYTITNFKILKKVEKEFFNIEEVFYYKREDLREGQLGVYEFHRVNTKDKSYKDLLVKSDKVLKFDKNYLLDGDTKVLSLNDNNIYLGYIQEILGCSLGKFKVNYFPVIKVTQVSNNDDNIDLENIPEQFLKTYNQLIALGKESVAKEMISKVNKAIRVAEGGSIKEYFVNNFLMIPNTMYKVIEEVNNADWLESDKSKVMKATSKEYKGKLLLNNLLVNVTEDVTNSALDLGFDADDSSFENSFIENSLNDKNIESIENVDNKVSENDNLEHLQSDNNETSVVNDVSEIDEFDLLFGD